MTRKEMLEKAMEQVTGGREEDYGKPEDNFRMIASLWTAYLHGEEITGKDVACMMILLKIARISAGKSMDSWVDIAGYAACGGEIDGCTR